MRGKLGIISSPQMGLEGFDGYMAFSLYNSSPYINAYEFSEEGFGLKFADPAFLPSAGAFFVRFSHGGEYIAIGSQTSSPYVVAYPFSPAGFGNRFTVPIGLPTRPMNGIDFSPDGNNIALAHSGGPQITVYAFSSSGFGAKRSNPSLLPGDNSIFTAGQAVAFSPDNSKIAVGSNHSNCLFLYPWSGTSFGAGWMCPDTLGSCGAVKFTPDSNILVSGHYNGSLVNAYDVSSGFGSKFPNPPSWPTGGVRAIDFSPDGNFVAFAHSNSPRVTVYEWSSSGFGAKVPNPSVLPTANCFSVKFSPDGSRIILCGSAIEVYEWSPSGFGAKLGGPPDPDGTPQAMDIYFL